MTSTTTAAPPRLGRDWRLLLGAGTVSMLGDGAFLAALPLLAATMTTDPGLIAGITVWGSLPWLLAALPMGAYADRHDARRTVTGAQLVQAALVAGLAAMVAAGAGGITVVYAIAFAVGLAETLAHIGLQKLVPAVVPAAQLEAANGRQQAALSSSKQFLGPPLGALLFTVAVTLPFWVDALTFAASAALVWRIRATTRIARPGSSLRTGIGEGVRWLAGNRLLRTLALLSGVANLANFLAMATFVLFAKQVLGLGDAGYGVVLGLMAVGGITGALVSGRVVRYAGGRRTVTFTLFATPLAMLAVGLFARDVVTVALLAFVTSFGAALWNVAAGSLRQRTVPGELLGRVSSAGLMVTWGAQPLGAYLGGLTATWWGLSAVWVVAALLRLTAATAALPALREWR
ncbi:MFS transporter [Catellatospora sichuanensis]|uniref:MFS transporter n=1 Tax=Catellatospora sichuanensis TaxID=1969805 RepID=UPI0011845702|nr:MFS transporter [Catellatospora sichuanensis]